MVQTVAGIPSNVAGLLEAPIIAILATRRRDETVMLSPVWYEWRDGGFSIWVDPASDGKVRHIRRDPRVTLVIATQDPPYKGLEVRAAATISTDDYFGVLERTARRYYEPDRAASLIKSYTEPGSVIRIVPGEVRSWDYSTG